MKSATTGIQCALWQRRHELKQVGVIYLGYAAPGCSENATLEHWIGLGTLAKCGIKVVKQEVTHCEQSIRQRLKTFNGKDVVLSDEIFGLYLIAGLRGKAKSLRPIMFDWLKALLQGPESDFRLWTRL